MVSGAVAFLSYTFDVFGSDFWTSGIGDWMDAYFVNGLLEHWHHSVWSGSDPSSPPIFFPARKTLGYSHTLVLYAPFYLPVRLLTHPFQAHSLALYAVMLTGIVCLYLVLRGWFRVSFVEAFLLTASFATSPNIINGGTIIWSQRASVFLIPPILLLGLFSYRLKDRTVGLVLAAFTGFLATSLFTQDFYTAQFALFFLMCAAGVAMLHLRREIAAAAARLWRERRRGEAPVFAVTAVATMWTLMVIASGGAGVRFAGLRISSHDPRRPAVIALASLALLLWLRGRSRLAADLRSLGRWPLSVGVGASVGLLGFLWFYQAAFLQHRAFPEADLLSQLVHLDPARWTHLSVFLRDVLAYDSARSLVLVIGAALLACMPRVGLNARVRYYWLAAALVSALVLVMPLALGGGSVWLTVFNPLPGFSVIRDPKRVIYLYELAVTLAVAFVLSSTAPRHVHRLAVVVALALLLATVRGRYVFEYIRPNAAYDQWVAAPIAIDPSCRSFFIADASPEYAVRPGDPRIVYGIDAMFIALSHAVPALNGYSALVPPGWDLVNPEEPVYPERVRRWIATNRLTGVCELDLVARTMTPAR